MVPSFWILSELDRMDRKASRGRGRDNPCLACSVGELHCQHQIHLAGTKADIFSIARLRQDVWSSSRAKMSHPRSPSGRDELCISIMYFFSSSLAPDDILPLEPVYSSWWCPLTQMVALWSHFCLVPRKYLFIVPRISGCTDCPLLLLFNIGTLNIALLNLLNEL